MSLCCLCLFFETYANIFLFSVKDKFIMSVRDCSRCSFLHGTKNEWTLFIIIFAISFTFFMQWKMENVAQNSLYILI